MQQVTQIRHDVCVLLNTVRIPQHRHTWTVRHAMQNAPVTALALRTTQKDRSCRLSQTTMLADSLRPRSCERTYGICMHTTACMSLNSLHPSSENLVLPISAPMLKPSCLALGALSRTKDDTPTCTNKSGVRDRDKLPPLPMHGAQATGLYTLKP